MSLWLYRLLWWCGTPWMRLRLRWRARRQPEYGMHVEERFGHYAAAVAAESQHLWVHAVSVGEVRAAAPLIEGLLNRSARHIVLTVMTPTGRATAEALFSGEPLARRVTVVYAPYDATAAVERFLRHFAPALCVVMETEVWPNQLALLAARGVPCVLANARLSAKSHAGYAQRRALFTPAFACFTHMLAQSEADAQRFIDLGARDVRMLGNVKYDNAPKPESLIQGGSWRDHLDTGRRVLLLAATREGEETLLLNAAAQLLNDPTLLLVLVPRHPQRFDDVAQLIAARSLRGARRSERLPDAQTQVWLGDSMGEMAAYIALADVVIVGGSVLKFGAQTPIEALAQGKPVLIGPHTYNFAEVTRSGIAAGAIIQCADAAALLTEARLLLADPARRETMGAAAHALIASSRGATDRSLALLEALLQHR